MKALIVARKTLLELLREPLLLALVLLMPPAFLIINALGYGAPLLVTHPVLVISSGPRGTALVEALQAQRYADGRPVFDITLTADQIAAETALKERTATALVVVSPGASGPLRATLRGDAVSMNFIRASTILNSVIKRYADRLAGQAEIVQVVEQALFAGGPQSWFDLYTPGIIVFGILMIIPQTAMLVAQEMRRHTLRRLRISRMGSWDLLAAPRGPH